MKTQRTIIVRVTFLLVFFSYGINAFSTKSVAACAIEFSSESNSELNFSNSDSFSDDQIYYLYEFLSIELNKFQSLSTSSFFVLKKSTISIWQPPELLQSKL